MNLKMGNLGKGGLEGIKRSLAEFPEVGSKLDIWLGVIAPTI